MLGQSIGQYKIVASLGVGGMGEVYLAQDTQLGRKVALKLLPSVFTQDQDRVRRFQQEARAASALNHPNIITIYGFGAEEERHFIVSEFVDGQTLRVPINETHSQTPTDQRSRSGNRLKLNDVLDVAIQVADALSAAHEVGIVHRDIKPENIMLRRRDRYVKVLDFGLAKLTEGTQDEVDTEGPTRAQVKTSAGVVMGTASYMSPEQARGEMLDVRTDIWSLGVVIYEMVAGCRPFNETSTNEVIASILQREPPPLLRYSREVPAELERIVTRALTKDREVRYQTAKDIAVDLRRLKQRMEVEAELERTGQREKDYDDETSHSEDPAVAAVIAPATSRNTFKLQTRTAVIILAALVAVTLVYFAYSRYAPGSDAGNIRSIAVLPFTNAGGNADAEYLSDGISESLINRLSQLPGVTVIARSSSFRYKDKEIDLQKVANDLGVQAILTGRVVQRGDDLVIRAELVNVSDRTQVWGDEYKGKATDVFQVQSDISRKIAETLRLRLSATTQQQLAKSETTNLHAYELLLQGVFYRNMGGPENGKKAIEFFKQATAIDPSYATAYAQLSESYRGLANLSVLDPKVAIPQAKAAALRALELDESLADAHYALAGVELDEWDWATAEREYQRAIELNTNLAKAHSGYSQYFTVMGRHGEAIAEIRRTRELDPISPLGKNAFAERLRMARQYDQALDALKTSLEGDQSFPNLHLTLGRVYAAKGQYTEAISAYQEAIRLRLDISSTNIYLGTAYALRSNREQAETILKRLTTSSEYVSPTQLAMLYAALGDNDQAFASLEKGYAARDVQLRFLGVDPAYDSLRGDPRFQDLLRRLKLKS